LAVLAVFPLKRNKCRSGPLFFLLSAVPAAAAKYYGGSGGGNSYFTLVLARSNQPLAAASADSVSNHKKSCRRPVC
jgi:hypothetical protein